jgi:Flp pilus assembly protein TadG
MTFWCSKAFLKDDFAMNKRSKKSQPPPQGEEGSSLIEVALTAPLLIFLLVGAIDFGRAFRMSIELAAAAQSGALYGVQNPSDTTGMASAAMLDANDAPSMQAVAIYGCECSDGSSASVSCSAVPTCSYNVVNYVEVDTSINYSPILIYPGISSPVALHGTAKMRAAH